MCSSGCRLFVGDLLLAYEMILRGSEAFEWSFEC
jgi:hypothetical protein